jgi:hypothetical protein
LKGKLFKDTSEIKDYSGSAKWCYPNGKVMRICHMKKEREKVNIGYAMNREF